MVALQVDASDLKETRAGDRYDLGVIRQRVLSTSVGTIYLRSPLKFS